MQPRVIAIEPFSARHQQGVASLILPIQQEEFGVPVTLGDQPDLLDTAAFYQHGRGNFWVALSDDTVVGSIGLLDIGDRQAALRKMFVAAAYRGKAHGVAQQLLDTLFAWVESQGLDTVFLGTTAQFLAAHRFYEKNGFDLIARDTLPAAFPVMKVDTRFYRYDAQSTR